MSEEVLKVIIVCITLIVIAVIVLVGYIFSTRNYYGEKDIKLIQQGLQRLQNENNGLYERYKYLTDKIDRGE